MVSSTINCPYAASRAGRLSCVFVLVASDDPNAVLGYDTLCATSLGPGEVPLTTRKHVPRYPLPLVAATLLGRLAVAQSPQGEGLGGLLLADALKRAYASAAMVGSSMVVVDAINEHAAAFYEAYGFIRLPDSLRLVMPTFSIAKLFA